MKDNFSLGKLGATSGDKGYFGAGIYFNSERTDYMVDNKVLLCKVIVGNVYYWPADEEINEGCPKKKDMIAILVENMMMEGMSG